MNTTSVGKKITIEELKARNILDMARFHKKHCDGDCGISVFYLLEDFERHMGRKATQEEIGFFL